MAPADQPGSAGDTHTGSAGNTHSGSAGNTHSTDATSVGPAGEDVEALVRALGVGAGHRLDGRYRLDRVLHPTGPAVTWLATDEKLNRLTRIHLLRSDEPRAKAFMEAARAAAAMPDNHFVQVLDAVPDDGLYYVITEWLHDGRTLGEVLAEGRLPVQEVVRITIELARAMAEAHDSGLAHLRLSPKTVLRTDTGEVKILDLCLAAALTGTVSRDPLGTDLTAIGELAYAMLTGKRPGSQPVPPSELRPDVTPQLDSVILRTLGDPSAGESFQSLVEVAEALSKLPRPRFEEPMRSTPQTAPLRHAQTQVIPSSGQGHKPPTYEPSPRSRPVETAARAISPYSTADTDPGARGVASHGATSHGGSHRPPAARPSYDDAASGAGGSKGMKIGLGAVAAVAAVALLAWQMMGSGDKGNTNGAGTAGGTGTSQSPTSGGTTPAAVGGPITIAAAYVYDSDDGTEGKEGLDAIKSGTGKGWATQSYCQAKPTASGKPKPGTGVVFDLGAQKQINDATLNILTAGAKVELLVGDSSVTAAPAVVANTAPANFTKVASATATGTAVDLKPAAPVTAQFVLVWFTDLPKEPVTNTKIKCAKPDGTYADTMTSVTFTGP